MNLQIILAQLALAVVKHISTCVVRNVVAPAEERRPFGDVVLNCVLTSLDDFRLPSNAPTVD